MGKTIRFNDKFQKQQEANNRGRFSKKFALSSRRLIGKGRSLQRIWPLVDEAHEGRQRI